MKRAPFSQICADIDARDLHAPWWNARAIATRTDRHFFFHGPPGVGKYAHALHLLREWSPSRFTSPVRQPFHIHIEEDIPTLSHYSNLPTQSFTFATSDVHMEIDLEQLGENPLEVWNKALAHARSRFPFVLCLHTDKAPSVLLERLYTYMLPTWPPTKSPPVRFLFLGENGCAIPSSLLTITCVVPFPRPSMRHYQDCLLESNPAENVTAEENRDIANICEFRSNQKMIHSIANDPFGPLCEKMVECIQSVESADTVYLFSIEDVRILLQEWAVYHICYEDGLWYVMGRLIAQGRFTKEQIKLLMSRWGAVKATAPLGATDYDEKRAEYMVAELIRILYNA